MLRRAKTLFLFCCFSLAPLHLLAQSEDTGIYAEDTASYAIPAPYDEPVVEEEVGDDYDEDGYSLTDTATSPVMYNSAKPAEAQWGTTTSAKAYGYRDKKEYFRKEPVREHKDPAWLLWIISFFHFLTTTAGKVILFCLLGLIIGYIVYRIVVGQGGSLFGRRDRRKKDIVDTAEVSEEGLQEGSWESALRGALTAGDHRGAIRFAWLHSLQMLQERGLIAYRQDKTNIQYYRELSESLRPAFRALSRQYEAAWYGAMIPDEAGLAAYLDTYNTLKRSLGNA